MAPLLSFEAEALRRGECSRHSLTYSKSRRLHLRQGSLLPRILVAREMLCVSHKLLNNQGEELHAPPFFVEEPEYIQSRVLTGEKSR